MNKKIKAAIAALASGHYTFDPKNTEWKHGKKIIDEEEILIYLIQFAKSQNIVDAGVFGDNALQSAKQAPEITVGAFVKRGIVRNRERRSAGKYLFAAWCKSIGIEIAGSLEKFMQKNSILAKLFMIPYLFVQPDLKITLESQGDCFQAYFLDCACGMKTMIK